MSLGLGTFKLFLAVSLTVPTVKKEKFQEANILNIQLLTVYFIINGARSDKIKSLKVKEIIEGAAIKGLLQQNTVEKFVYCYEIINGTVFNSLK